jgi:hypothetical protein
MHIRLWRLYNANFRPLQRQSGFGDSRRQLNFFWNYAFDTKWRRRFKAPEDWRSPSRFAFKKISPFSRQRLGLRWSAAVFYVRDIILIFFVFLKETPVRCVFNFRKQ